MKAENWIRMIIMCQIQSHSGDASQPFLKKVRTKQNSKQHMQNTRLPGR